MSHFRNIVGDVLAQPWRVTALAVGGLLAAIIAAGLLGFVLNRHIAGAAEETLRYDVQLEDRGHELEVAVLEVRHQHRNIAFLDRSASGLGEFDRAYERLQQEIDAYEDLGVREPGMVSPDELRAMTAEYRDAFRPAVGLAGSDPEAFERASEEGLGRLKELEEAAIGVDEAGEELARASLRQMNGAATTSASVLLAVLGGLLLVGTALAYALVRVVNQLRDFSRAKTDFLADVSHELRTPLTVLRGNAEVGLALGDAGCSHGKMLRKIIRESERMGRMVDDLLFLARSDSAAPPVRREAVDAGPFLAEIAQRAEVLLRERGCRLVAALRAGGVLEADPARLEQAVMAVVDNAAKYGCPEGEVRLTAVSDGARLRLEISDEGPGIPEGDLERVFERFYRPDKGRSKAVGGAGLGLSIARAVVEAHGGSINAEVPPGGGTTVTLLLPLSASGTRRGDRPGGEPNEPSANRAKAPDGPRVKA